MTKLSLNEIKEVLGRRLRAVNMMKRGSDEHIALTQTLSLLDKLEVEKIEKILSGKYVNPLGYRQKAQAIITSLVGKE